jgi:hypothetical protein
MSKKTQNDIKWMCDGIRDMLIQKNLKYNDSATSPKRIFSAASSIEQLLVRIDDKLSRIEQLGWDSKGSEDTLSDLIGYLILLKIAINQGSAEYDKYWTCQDCGKDTSMVDYDYLAAHDMHLECALKKEMKLPEKRNAKLNRAEYSVTLPSDDYILDN